jgi:LmbE family N-acetylglucosaminyl deacetylase
VSFHAHPDDEALLTAGSLAKAVADGHRVVLVVATAGEAGLASQTMIGDDGLGKRRVAELVESARRIGCARVEVLGYADSGYGESESLSDASPAMELFASADLETAAKRLAALLTEERADVLTIYDAAGGYGHVDHVQVHRVGLRAAALASTPVVLEATIDRARLVRAVSLLRRLRWLLPGLDLPDFHNAYTDRRCLTHRIDVRQQLAAKRAAMAAHRTQSTADSGLRTLGLLLKLPRPVFALACRYEWFVERGRTPVGPLLDDMFATLRDSATSR